MSQKFKSLFGKDDNISSTSSSSLSHDRKSLSPSPSTPLLAQFYEATPPGYTIQPNCSTDIQSIRTSSISNPSSADNSAVPSLTQSYDVISQRNGHHPQNDDDDSLGEENNGQISWVMAAFLLINAALGAGLLNYPVAYDRLGGIGFATGIQIFAVMLMATTILVLVYCARVNNESSYHGVMRTMCGKRVMQFSAASIAITCFGICVTFVIIIGDQFDRIFATYIGPTFCQHWYVNRYFTMAVTSIFAIWPMCYFRRLDFLRHINLLGVVASMYVIFLNAYEYYKVSNEEHYAPPIRTVPSSGIEFIAALPVVFFAYQTHEIVIPVHLSMKDKSISAFAKSTGLSLATLLLLYCTGGTYGYLTFGSKVAPDIMLMYDANDTFVLVGIIALIVKMVTTYPPVVFCGRDTIVRIMLSSKRKSKENGYQTLRSSGSSSNSDSQAMQAYRKYHITITTAWNLVVLALAIITPNITVAIGFLGSLASCNVFIFPGLCLIALARKHRRIRKNYFFTSELADELMQQQQQQQYQEHQLSQQHQQQQPSTSVAHSNIGDAELMTATTNSSSRQTSQQQSHQPWYSLSRRSIQIFLITYGAFIIAMGVVMFVIILIQVYHDFQQPMSHGAVCDANDMPPSSTTSKL